VGYHRFSSSMLLKVRQFRSTVLIFRGGDCLLYDDFSSTWAGHSNPLYFLLILCLLPYESKEPTEFKRFTTQVMYFNDKFIRFSFGDFFCFLSMTTRHATNLHRKLVFIDLIKKV
jgi:hypothetical protein